MDLVLWRCRVCCKLKPGPFFGSFGRTIHSCPECAERQRSAQRTQYAETVGREVQRRGPLREIVMVVERPHQPDQEALSCGHCLPIEKVKKPRKTRRCMACWEDEQRVSKKSRE